MSTLKTDLPFGVSPDIWATLDPYAQQALQEDARKQLNKANVPQTRSLPAQS